MQSHQDKKNAARSSRRRRLQRSPTSSGYRVDTFAEVLIRHGGLMGGLALICLLLPRALEALQATTLRSVEQPQPYLLGLLAILVFFVVWSARRPESIERQSRWVVYLLFISVAEELAFRLVLPMTLQTHMGWLAACAVSNAIFAAIHYLTLRWRLRNCVVTFLGGMGLSQLLTNGDLTLVIMLHWVGTFLNTPHPPSRKKITPA